MKKLKYFLLVVLFLPIMVSAKEYCTVVSGNGKDIGSEISCGGENFYIINNEGETLKLLSKYNLDTGFVFEEVVVSESRFQELVDTYRTCSQYEPDSCWIDGDITEEEEFRDYNSVDRENEEHHSFIMLKEIKNRKLKQSPKAIGIHGERDNPEYPEYGVVTMLVSGESTGIAYGGYRYTDLILDSVPFFGDGNLMFSLEDYGDYLYDQGIELGGIDLITIKEIDELIYKISGEHLPLEEWASNDWEAIPSHFDGYYYLLGNMKEFIPAGYEWIYSTTYWTRTFRTYDSQYFYFVDTQGDICNGHQCQTAAAGIRPVIEIEKDNVKYTIKTETDGNGTIEVVDTASGGETITFRVSAKKDYKLTGLTITADNGEKVEFNEEDITQNSDGTISISTNIFTMPYSNVTIQARWSIVNPYTSRSIWLVLIVLMVTGVGMLAIKKEKTN